MKMTYSSPFSIMLMVLVASISVSTILISGTTRGSNFVKADLETQGDQDMSFECGLNYVSNSHRFYQNDSVTSNDFMSFSEYNITHLSIHIVWKSFDEDYVNLTANFHSLLNVADSTGMKVQLDFWTRFSPGGSWTMPNGISPWDIIRVPSVTADWLDFVSNATNEFKSHTSIESWTMMNEPYAQKGTNDDELFYQCWRDQREIMRSLDPRPLSIRLALGDSPWSGDFNRTEVFQVCDYIAITNYLDPGNNSDTRWGGNWTQFYNCVSECKSRSIPLVIAEFGMNTSTFEDRAVYYNRSLCLFKSKGIEKAYAFCWQTILPENASFNIYGYNPITPMFSELVAAQNTPFVLGDMDCNSRADLQDLILLAQAYGSCPGHEKWNAYADIDANCVVGITDLFILARHYEH